MQYSVQETWKSKISGTLKRLKITFPDVNVLVFLSSREIGAQGDELVTKLRKEGVHLDIRDRSWFLDRLNTDDQRSAAATELARAIVDPILTEKGIIKSTAALSGQEAKTALVFLELQARDEDSSKGLTKACFESLVRAALQGSSDTQKISRDDIHRRIHGFLPRHTQQQLAQFIDSALQRMSKNVIKRHPGDLFHLSFEETELTKDRLAGLAVLGEAFTSDVADIAIDYHGGDAVKRQNISDLVRKTVEIYLYRLGEEFAQAVTHDKDVPLHGDTLRNVVIEVAPKGRAMPNESWVDYLRRVTISTLSTPSSSTKELLRVLSTSYTLFAFLEEVPDVQKVTKKLFSNAVIWLDTSVILPLIAEQAYPSEDRPFTDMMIQAKRSGIRLVMTFGILEEVESHLHLCRTYILKHREWESRVPYVYQRYVMAGKRHDTFTSWLGNFMGDHRPLDDLIDSLNDLGKIEVEDPTTYQELDQGMVSEIKSYWHEVQDRRRGENTSWFNSFRLADHDIENYLSVLAERKNDRANSGFGYRSWLMSLDSAAWYLRTKVTEGTAKFIGHSPLISVDFLIKYLSFGPRRDQVSASGGYSRAFQPSIYESVSPELIAAAEQIRETCGSLPERQIQRRIRDGMDKQRMKMGDVQKTGLEGMYAAISDIGS